MGRESSIEICFMYFVFLLGRGWAFRCSLGFRSLRSGFRVQAGIPCQVFRKRATVVGFRAQWVVSTLAIWDPKP